MVTHLQFSDDTLFFCEPSREEVRGYKVVLRCFELVLGLRINLNKSTLIGIDVEASLLKDLAYEVGCGTTLSNFRSLT